MKILVTGGSGFLGSALSRRHLEEGDEVRILAKEATALEAANSRELQESGVEVFTGGVEDPELCERALAGVSVVYHVAAAMREANVPDSHFWDVNVRATETLLRLSAEARVSRFVYCSTSGAVGPSHGRRTDEETECHPKDIYQTTKLAAERAALTFHREHGLKVSAVRPAGVYGPGDGRLLKLFRMVQKGRFLMVGDGSGRHDLIYIDDLIDGMRLAAEKDEAVGQCFNLASGSPAPLSELVAEVAQQLGVACRILRVPMGPMRALATVIEFSCRPFGIQPPLYRRRLDFFKHDEDFDISKARTELGFAPKVSLADGIARTIDAYRSKGWLS